MAFDNIKLDKGLYTTSKGFTASLEEIDPSENYIGTELEGLDAFQRQLKRFDIKVSGADSDNVAKFFSTVDSATLFPEYISRAVAQGIEENDPISKLVAATTEIDSYDYRSIESIADPSDLSLADIAEGAVFPETVIKVKDKLTKLKKRGRMLVASYEAIKFQKLDLFTLTLKQIGAQISHDQMYDFRMAVDSKDVDIEKVPLTGGFTYENMVKIWQCIYPFKPTTMFVGSNALTNVLSMSEFRESGTGFNFCSTGQLITPFGAELVPFPELGVNQIFVLDRNAAVEKVQAGGVLTEYDKLIDRQLERATISTIYGFSVINKGAIKSCTLA